MGIAAYFGVDLAAGRTQGNRDLGSAQVDPGVELVRFCHQSGLATSQYITDHRSVKMAQSRGVHRRHLSRLPFPGGRCHHFRE